MEAEGGVDGDIVDVVAERMLLEECLLLLHDVTVAGGELVGLEANLTSGF